MNNAKSAYPKSTVISDAKMASVLANSNWAKMELDAKHVPGTTQKAAKKTAVKTLSLPGETMSAAHDIDPEVVSTFQKTVTDCSILPPDKGAVSDDCAHFFTSPWR